MQLEPIEASLAATRTISIVFARRRSAGAGYVDSLARPGDNVTGFTLFSIEQSGKWIELLKEMAPGLPSRRAWEPATFGHRQFHERPSPRRSRWGCGSIHPDHSPTRSTPAFAGGYAATPRHS